MSHTAAVFHYIHSCLYSIAPSSCIELHVFKVSLNLPYSVNILLYFTCGNLVKLSSNVPGSFCHMSVTLQVTGVGYNAHGRVTCDGEVVRENTHPSIRKLVEVSLSFLKCFL